MTLTPSRAPPRKAVVQTGAKSWFFITADFAFGHSLESEAVKAVQALGGKVVGRVRHPFNAPDMSSFVLQAQSSKAEVIGLANSSVDAINAIKQGREFGVVAGGQKIAAMIMLLNDVHALGLEAGQGLYLTEPFYWDFNDATRAFSAKFAPRVKNTPAEHDPCRRLRERAALHEGREGCEHCRRPCSRREDERAADR